MMRKEMSSPALRHRAKYIFPLCWSHVTHRPAEHGVHVSSLMRNLLLRTDPNKSESSQNKIVPVIAGRAEATLYARVQYSTVYMAQKPDMHLHCTVASAPTVTGSVFMRIFRLFLGQSIPYCTQVYRFLNVFRISLVAKRLKLDHKHMYSTVSKRHIILVLTLCTKAIKT